MKVRIQRKSHFFSQLLFELDSKEIEYHQLVDLDDPVLNLPLKGFYDILNDQLIFLYKENSNQIILRIDNLEFLIDETFFIAYTSKDVSGTLTIRNNLNTAEIIFDTKDCIPISTIYYTEDEEDVNFWIWLSNVLNSEERKNILLDAW